MRKLLAAVLVALAFLPVFAGDVVIQRTPYGSGHLMNEGGVENTFQVQPGVFHAPQYMPHWPTAATLWARVVEVDCDTEGKCDGYNYSPEMGRAEYLFFRPRAPKVAPKPEVVTLVCPAPETKTVYVEVPVKVPQQ